MNGQIWSCHIDRLSNDQGGAGEDTFPNRQNLEAVLKAIPQALGSKDTANPQVDVENFSESTHEIETTDDPSTSNESVEWKSYPERICGPPDHYEASFK